MAGKSCRHSSEPDRSVGYSGTKNGDERYEILPIHEKIRIVSVVKACIFVKEKMFEGDNMIERIGGREKR